MALTRDKKEQIVNEVADLLGNSKMVVAAKYTGTGVKAMQELKRTSKETNTAIKVIKNRLVMQALKASGKFDNTQTNALKGQLLYAFNADDEIAPAQVLANFAKKQPTIEFVGAFTSAGQFIDADDVKSLAQLPSKDQLRGQLVGLFASPLSGLVNVMAGNVRGVMNVLNARSESIK